MQLLIWSKTQFPQLGFQRPKAMKIDVLITSLSFDAPSPENPCEYPHKHYIARN